MEQIKHIIDVAFTVCPIILAAIAITIISVKILVPTLYKAIYDKYIVIDEENLVVLDVRVYVNTGDYLIVESEDMDRFMFEEPSNILVVPGDVLIGLKESNSKTGRIKYFYKKKKVYSKLDRQVKK